MMKKFILASNSPRRKELLNNCGYVFEIKPSRCDENTDGALSPQETVKELARRKALSVLAENEDAVVLGCDTVVAVDGKILGKPRDREDAFDMLMSLSGKKHIVSSGVCIADRESCECFENTTEVEFYPLSAETVNSYLDTGEYSDKAGGYGIQGYGSVLVKGIKGDYFSVMGLPVSQSAAALSRFGIEGKVKV
ncbi:MAG: septum formation protein Maf [Clostridia bacterium]|nr:septum formation protein Maf [Clostridia bacterium]